MRTAPGLGVGKQQPPAGKVDMVPSDGQDLADAKARYSGEANGGDVRRASRFRVRQRFGERRQFIRRQHAVASFLAGALDAARGIGAGRP